MHYTGVQYYVSLVYRAIEVSSDYIGSKGQFNRYRKGMGTGNGYRSSCQSAETASGDVNEWCQSFEICKRVE